MQDFSRSTKTIKPPYAFLQKKFDLTHEQTYIISTFIEEKDTQLLVEYLVHIDFDVKKYEKMSMYAENFDETLHEYLISLLEKSDVKTVLKFKNFFNDFDYVCKRYVPLSYFFQPTENLSSETLVQLYNNNFFSWNVQRRKEFIDLYTKKFNMSNDILFQELIHGKRENVKDFIDHKHFNEYLLYLIFYEPKYIEKMLIVIMGEKVDIDVNLIMPTEIFYERYIFSYNEKPSFDTFLKDRVNNNEKDERSFNFFVTDLIRCYYDSIMKAAEYNGGEIFKVSKRLNEKNMNYFI